MKYVKEIKQGDYSLIESFEANTVEEIINLKKRIESTEKSGHNHVINTDKIFV